MMDHTLLSSKQLQTVLLRPKNAQLKPANFYNQSSVCLATIVLTLNYSIITTDMHALTNTYARK